MIHVVATMHDMSHTCLHIDQGWWMFWFGVKTLTKAQCEGAGFLYIP